MDAREQQAREILEEMGINPDVYWGRDSAQGAFSKKAEMTAQERRAQNLADRVAKASGFGGETVRQALESGIKITFADGLGNQEGCFTQTLHNGYFPSDKKIVLNAGLADEQLMTALVRLARVSRQSETVDPQMTMHGAIMTARAKAADAKACEAAAAYEMRLTEPKAYQAFFDKNMLIAGAYYYAVQETGNEMKALNRTAKAWYDDSKKVAASDEAVFDCMTASGLETPDAFCSDLSVSRLSDVFSYRGSFYMEKDFLRSGKAGFVTENQAKRIENIEKSHKQTFEGKNPEKIRTSADAFYVRRQDGTVRPPQKPASVFARLSARFGR